MPNITKVVFITSGTTFSIPADFVTLISVQCIGGGGSGAHGGNNTGAAGGGGAYAASTAVTGLVAGGMAYVNVGAGGAPTSYGLGDGSAGGDTWFNAASATAPTSTTQGALAKGGGAVSWASTAGGAGGHVGCRPRGRAAARCASGAAASCSATRDSATAIR